MSKTHCETCKVDISSKFLNVHNSSKAHLKKLGKVQAPLENKAITIDYDADDENDEEDKETDEYLNDNDDERYLEGFLNTPSPTPQPQSQRQPKTQNIKVSKPESKPVLTDSNSKLKSLFYKHITKKPQTSFQDIEKSSVASDEIFSSKHTPILGKPYREALARIKQYKQLFKNELKGLKVKKNATVRDLENYITEIEAILDTSSAEAYANDAIFHILNVVEATSSNFKQYNLTGLSAVLKNNIQFNQLVKVLCAKYSVFNSTPPEALLALTLASSIYIVVHENRLKEELNQPIEASKSSPIAS